MTKVRAALVAYALALVSAGCSYQHLSFFFDGVPPPQVPVAGTAPFADSRRAVPPAVTLFEHGPYAARLCNGCHASGLGNALLVPAERLCDRCHTLALRKKFVHGPLTAGGCLLCHDPHSSRYAYLLVSDSGTFCLKCHDRSALRRIEGHEDVGASCTTCHEAHMSDRRYLLR